MGTPWSGPSAAPDCTAASAARAEARADSPITVMYAFTLPSMAVMRSRWACTTSTGETFLPAIMAASSVIDVEQSSLTECPRSEDPELRRGLGLDGQVADGREAIAAAFDQGQERGQLRVGELQSLRPRENAQRVDGELFHAGRIAHNLCLVIDPADFPDIALGRGPELDPAWTPRRRRARDTGVGAGGPRAPA